MEAANSYNIEPSLKGSVNTLKVALVTPFYKPSIGGVEYIVYHTARELLKRGFEVHVVSTTHDNRWERVAQPSITVEDHGDSPYSPILSPCYRWC